jgi:hypothetical protein
VIDIKKWNETQGWMASAWGGEILCWILATLAVIQTIYVGLAKPEQPASLTYIGIAVIVLGGSLRWKRHQMRREFPGVAGSVEIVMESPGHHNIGQVFLVDGDGKTVACAADILPAVSGFPVRELRRFPKEIYDLEVEIALPVGGEIASMPFARAAATFVRHSVNPRVYFGCDLRVTKRDLRQALSEVLCDHITSGRPFPANVSVSQDDGRFRHYYPSRWQVVVIEECYIPPRLLEELSSHAAECVR